MDVQATAKQTAKVSKRFGGWWITAILAFAVVFARAPQQAEVVTYKLLLVAISIGMSYLADRSLFKNAPGIDLDHERDNVSAARILARAVIALAVIQGITSGL